MPDAERDPSVLVSARLADHPKLLHLSSDRARWGWIVVLGRAKLRRPAGQFPSRRVLAHDLGVHARYIDEYVGAGLLEDRDGALVIHDWAKHQDKRVDPTAAERQRFWRSGGVGEDPKPGSVRTREWRIRNAVFERDDYTCRYCGTSDYPREWLVAEHVVPGGPLSLDNLVTSCRGCNKRKGRRTPDEAGMRVLPLPQVTRHGDTSQEASDTSPRGRASALSPSLSQSPLHPVENGTAVPAQAEPEDLALAFLAGIGAHVRPDGNGIHRKLVDLVRRRGLEPVMATLAELHAADPGANGRQLVFGAENALDRPAVASTKPSPKGYHAQEDPSLAFRR